MTTTSSSNSNLVLNFANQDLKLSGAPPFTSSDSQAVTRNITVPYQQIDLTKCFSDHLSGLGTGTLVRNIEWLSPQYSAAAASPPTFCEPVQGRFPVPSDLNRFTFSN